MSPSQLTTLVLTLTLLFPCTLSTTCTTPKLSTPPNAQCTQLSALSSALHYSYNPSNKTLFVAFSATPPSPSGWVAWGINPTATGMAGTQAILAYKNSNGSMSVMTLNISSYSNLTESALSFPVYQKSAQFNSKDGSITIYASVKSDGGKINHVWQVGPGVAKGFPMKHEFGQENLHSTGTLDLSSKSLSSTSSSSGGDNGLKKRNIHGILNAISWGILLPVGAIIARYLRTFESAEPTWFYLHITCQISGYVVGVAGWATGLQLGNESKGIVYKGHRCIGFVLFCLATLQIFALLARPKKEHKYRFYWNIYHHGVGYAILTLGIINVFKGLEILQPENKWKSTYVTILIVLGCVAVLLEALTWIMFLRRKSNRSTKPYA